MTGGFRLGGTNTHQTCTLAHHLSLASLMVKASRGSSEGCGFDLLLGLGISGEASGHAGHAEHDQKYSRVKNFFT